MKRLKIYITKGSVNLIREFKNFNWKEDLACKATNERIDKFNHGIIFGETASLSRCGEVCLRGKGDCE